MSRSFALALAFVLAPPAYLTLGEEGPAKFRRVTTIAGNGSTGPAREKGMALRMPLSNPFGVQPESDGSLIIASFDQHVLYRLEPSYRRMELIAGIGEAGFTNSEAKRPIQVAMNEPHEIQLDSMGNIFIADTKNHRVGMIDAATGRWAAIAGTGEAGFGGDGDLATKALLNQAYSIVLSGQELFVADLKNHRIRRVDLVSRIITTVCGTGVNALPTEGGKAIEQPLQGPRSLAADQDSLWIVLREGNSVWRLDRNDGRLYRVAGTGKKGYSGDGGPALDATFRGPKGIAVDPGVALYVADTENHAIRRIDLKSGRITTVIGTGKAGFNGDGDELARCQLARPHGICLLKDGSLVIGDSENHRLRMLTQ